MRGGDSLMSWISRLNGVIWNIRHSSSCIHSPTVRCPSSVFFVNRFRSADCQKIQLPLGGSRGEEAIRFCHSSNRSVSRAAGGFYPPLQFGRGSCCHSTNGSVSSGFGRLRAAPTRCGGNRGGWRVAKLATPTGAYRAYAMFFPLAISSCR